MHYVTWIDLAKKMADELDGQALGCDVSDSSAVQKMFEEVRAKTDHLDILVNNAGISGMEGDNSAQSRMQAALDRAESAGRGVRPDIDPAITDVTDEAWSKMIAVHLNGTFYCSRSAAAMMTSQKASSGTSTIINMGSIMGTSGGAGAAAYCAAKAGILGFTRALARDLAPYEVRVNAIAPGYILTDMTSPSEVMFPLLKAATPMGRLGEPDDIAWAAVYLASEEAKFVTGQTFSPNGGWHMSQ